jgi:predicted RNA-binding Zn-ribbon protein involved in translation (DUF1610 family)
MAMEMEHSCPTCGEERTFYRSASTELHLGEKTKWYCEECGHRVVRIDGAVDTATA